MNFSVCQYKGKVFVPSKKVFDWQTSFCSGNKNKQKNNIAIIIPVSNIHTIIFFYLRHDVLL